MYRNYKHGQSGHNITIEYKTWMSMRYRCAHSPGYIRRNTTVCERWDDYENFLADMGRKPSPELTLERMDNDGNYEPGNCKWGTREEQRKNQKTRILDRDKVNQIRGLYRRGIYTPKQFGYLFDISKFTVYSIVNNNTWKNEPPDLEILFATTDPHNYTVKGRDLFV